MSPTETAFKNRIRPVLSGLANTWAVKIQQLSISGTPDFLLCVNGRFVALELKRDAKARVTALQKHALQKIAAAGGLSLVAYPDNWSEIFGKLVALSQGEKVEA